MSQSDFVTRGQALVTAGQYQEAVKVCRLGLLGRPTTVEGRVVLGQALLALKRYDEVLAEMRVALELDHASITAQVLKGEALLRKGDAQGAAEVLQRVRSQAPTDPRIAELLGDAERALGRPRISAVHPSVGFLGTSTEAPTGPGPGEIPTKAYVGHQADEEDTDDNSDEGQEDTGGSYTRPTALAAPGPRKRSQPMPSPEVLAVGDRSGTVEVDPELDGVELGGGDDELGDVASPPNAGKRRPARDENARGQVISSSRSPVASSSKSRAPLPGPRGGGVAAARKPKARKEVSSVELDSDDLVELDEVPESAPRTASPKSAVRNAVKMPSGPLDALRPNPGYPAPNPAATRPTALAQPAVAPPPHLAQMIANAPHVLQMSPQPMPQPVNPRSALAASLPTQAAMPVPPLPMGGPMGQPTNLAQRPTALTQAQQESAAAVDAMFNGEQSPAWARSTVAAGGPGYPAPEAAGYAPAPGIDPQIAAMLAGEPSTPSAVSIDLNNQSGIKARRTGVRKGRSKFAIAIWVFLGALVIGGGVFAGFQIRAMRLGKQISAAREQAVALAKADTWAGWVGARDRLAGIAQASATLDNRVALARTRALVAYEFGDGLPEAKAAVDSLGGQGGLAAQLAAGYLALAQNDAKAARAAADAATASSANDAATLYVNGQAHLLAGDAKAAIASLKSALDKEARPIYAIGLARAFGVATQWDDALAAIDSALAMTPDHPGALIERAVLLSASGRIVPGAPIAKEVRTQLEKIIAEGAKPAAEQTRGVSPAQVAFAHLALARVDFGRGEVATAAADARNALSVGLDEQRFAEEIVETYYAINIFPNARAAAERVLAQWPTSRRAMTTLAQTMLATGKLQEALDLLAKSPDLAQYPKALAVRGQIRLVMKDLDNAGADFDSALKKSPSLEHALAGRAWVDLMGNNVEAARKRIEPLVKGGSAATASPTIATVYAAILRASGTPADRETAKTLLDRVANGAPSLEIARAQVERGRLYRDLGNFDEARKAYENAAKVGIFEARLESGLLAIEDRDPAGGRAALDVLVKEAGDQVPPGLLLEAARARILDGDHSGAAVLFELADKTKGVTRWQLARERGRLALRKGDFAAAVQYLSNAIEECGDDAETFLLAADAASDGKLDAKKLKLVERVRALAPGKLKARPEASIVAGKLAIADNDYDAAAAAFEAARAALINEKASPRRQAQANFGRAVAAYYKEDDPSAQTAFDFVTDQDPSIFAAYLYLSDMVKDKDLKRAFAYAQSAVRYNPDLVAGWAMVGTLAARLGKRKDLAQAISRLNELAPNTDELRQLQRLR